MSHDAIDQAIDILEKNSEASDKNQGQMRGRHYDDEKDQPQHFSWVHIDVEAPNCCTDTSSCIMYGDAEEMQQQFLEYARHMVTTIYYRCLGIGNLCISRFALDRGH
jgi:hypothetical protein